MFFGRIFGGSKLIPTLPNINYASLRNLLTNTLNQSSVESVYLVHFTKKVHIVKYIRILKIYLLHVSVQVYDLQ